MEKGKWIWREGAAEADEYVQFRSEFLWDGKDEVRLAISADTDYMVWLNGKFAGCGQYQDYPWHRVKDDLDITAYLQTGRNVIAVLVWYYGADCMTYTKGDAGLWYEITESSRILACSGAHVMSRLAGDFVSHRQELLTPQLGFNASYDFRGADDWTVFPQVAEKGFTPCVEREASEFFPRPVEKLTIHDFYGGNIVQRGIFIAGKSERDSVRMDESFMSVRSEKEFLTEKTVKGQVYSTQECCDGIYLIVDLGKEMCGYLDFSIQAEAGTKISVGYGEHLADGRVRCAPSIRNFVFSFTASGKTDEYFNGMRRLGLRYLQLFVYGSKFVLHRLGIRPCSYPVKVCDAKINNYLRRKIYDMSVNTLQLCMHEHYEDCPWREQALYTTDSRNQILAGYYAFGEKRFPRACFELMLRGVNEDGYLNICFPAGYKQVIPMFTLTFFLELGEYLVHSGDIEFFSEHYQELKVLLEKHLSRLGKSGLVKNFVEKGDYWKYWNFYEWKPMLNGNQLNDRESYDAILNAFLSIALQNMAKIAVALKKADDAAMFEKTSEQINKSIRKEFFDSEAGVFKAYRGKYEGCISVLANAVCVLCGAAEGVPVQNLEKLLADFELEQEKHLGITNALGSEEEEYKGETVVGCTLSMLPFQFDALLKLNRNKYAPYVLEKIDEIYYYMISQGATACWETLLGESDFDNAGSLCHGWAAMPVYYYNILKDFM